MKFETTEVIESLFVAEDGRTYKINMGNGMSKVSYPHSMDEVFVTISDGSHTQLSTGDVYSFYSQIIFQNIYTVDANENKYIEAMNRAIDDFNEQLKINNNALDKFNKLKKLECEKREALKGVNKAEAIQKEIDEIKKGNKIK